MDGWMDRDGRIWIVDRLGAWVWVMGSRVQGLGVKVCRCSKEGVMD